MASNAQSRSQAAMFLDIQKFHKKFNLVPYDEPWMLPDELTSFREKFIVEEALETKNAMMSKNKPEALDGLIDLSYVALGTYYLQGGELETILRFRVQRGLSLLLLSHISEGFMLDRSRADYATLLDISFGCREMAMSLGWHFDKGWDRVQRANMSKVRALSAKEGKRGSTWDVVKPKGWVAPVMDDLV